MKLEVRVFPLSPIICDEITAWLKDQSPRVPVSINIVERFQEERVAVYVLFLDAFVVQNVAAGVPVASPVDDSEALAWEMARSETRRKENEALLDVLQRYHELALATEEEIKKLAELGIKLKRGNEDVELTAKTAELLKKHGRA